MLRSDTDDEIAVQDPDCHVAVNGHAPAPEHLQFDDIVDTMQALSHPFHEPFVEGHAASLHRMSPGRNESLFERVWCWPNVSPMRSR